MKSMHPRALMILRRAYELIKPEENFTTGVLAATHAGRICAPSDPLACKFCSIGAVDRATFEFKEPNSIREQVIDALNGALAGTGYAFIVDANDMGGHSVAVELFEDALAANEAPEAPEAPEVTTELAEPEPPVCPPELGGEGG